MLRVLVGGLAALAVLCGLMLWAMRAERQADRERVEAALAAAVDAGILQRPPAWEPSYREDLAEWFELLKEPLLLLEGEAQILRGAFSSGPARGPRATDAEVLEQLRSLQHLAPPRPWIFGPKDVELGWQDWSSVQIQLRGLGRAVRRETELLLGRGEADRALATLVEFLSFVRGFEGYDYSQLETLIRTERDGLLALGDLLAMPGDGPGGLALDPAAVREALGEVLQSGLGWDRAQARLVRSFDARLRADRSEIFSRDYGSEGQAGLAAAADLLVVMHAGDHQPAPADGGTSYFGEPRLLQDLAAIYSSCVSLQRHYAWALALLELVEATAEAGAWPVAGALALPVDPATGEAFVYRIEPDRFVVEGAYWGLRVMGGADQPRPIWARPR